MKRKASYNQGRKQKRPRTVALVGKDAQDYSIVRSPRVDYKVTDLAFSGSATTTANLFYCSANLVAGTSYVDNYIGREIFPAGFDFRIEIVGAESNAVLTADQTNLTRVLVFQWMDDATPTAALILQNTAATTACMSSIRAKNYNNINVLIDKTFSTWTTATLSNFASSNAYSMRRYIKGKKMRTIEMDGANVIKGAIWALIVSDSGVAPNPGYSGYCRLTFTDA